MKTFYWVQKEKEGYTELYCYHTQHNKITGKMRRICTILLSLPEKVERTKRSFENGRKHVVKGGAWKPKKGAKWSFTGSDWVIDESQIVKVA